MIKLNLASHGDNLPGYLNVDYDEETADLKADVTDLPLEDESVDEILAFHILEHFRMGDYEAHLSNPLNNKTVWDALAEWRRVLKPGGVLHIKVPDFNKCVHLYNQNPQWARGAGPDGTFPNVFYWLSGNGQHQAIFDRPTMTQVLLKAGFSPPAFMDHPSLAIDRQSLEMYVKVTKP